VAESQVTGVWAVGMGLGGDGGGGGGAQPLMQRMPLLGAPLPFGTASAADGNDGGAPWAGGMGVGVMPLPHVPLLGAGEVPLGSSGAVASGGAPWSSGGTAGASAKAGSAVHGLDGGRTPVHTPVHTPAPAPGK
jgi:hypothetical protein